MEVSGHLDYLQKLVDSGGPNHSDFENISNVALALMELSIEDKAKLFDILKPIINMNSMIGHTFLKPYGYEGDFDLIYKIYTKWKTERPEFQNWDELYHWADSVKAVRKRKQYFIDQVSKISSNNDMPLVLNLGSGPCIDVFEFFQKSPRSLVKFECVDMDDRSIEFGAAVCDNYIDSITFTNENVFNFKSEKEFDLIWSAGLFDYFNDNLFIILLKRYFKLLKKGGKLVIANFSDLDPSRGLMEVLCQSSYHHRSKDKLTELALKAGITKANIVVKPEKTNINLYLHISK